MQRFLVLILIAMMPLSTSCVPLINGGNVAVVEPVAGGEFNKFFPSDDGDYNVIFMQEKEGFAQAQLNFQGSEVATLSISDTANNPEALEKFDGSNAEISGYPSASVGSLGTALLVADRFQVQVRSKDDSFDADQRQAWLEQFDLAGLAGLAN